MEHAVFLKTALTAIVPITLVQNAPQVTTSILKLGFVMNALLVVLHALHNYSALKQLMDTIPLI